MGLGFMWGWRDTHTVRAGSFFGKSNQPLGTALHSKPPKNNDFSFYFIFKKKRKKKKKLERTSGRSSHILNDSNHNSDIISAHGGRQIQARKTHMMCASWGSHTELDRWHSTRSHPSRQAGRHSWAARWYIPVGRNSRENEGSSGAPAPPRRASSPAPRASTSYRR